MRRICAGLLLVLLAFPSWAGKAVVSSPKGANVYSAPGKKAKKVDLLARNAEVETFEAREGRVHVRFEGGEGWVAKTVLRELPSKAAQPDRAADQPSRPASKSQAPPPAPSPAPAPSQAPSLPPPAAVAPAASPSAPLPTPTAPAAPNAAAEKPPTEGGYLSQALKEEPVTKVEGGPGLVTVLGSLFVVLALVAGAVYLVKMLAGRRLVGGARSKGIQVLASRPLGPRQALLLVEVGGLPLLLAQSEGMVNLISEIRDPEAVKRLNDLYGFRETPFEAELKSRFDLESEQSSPLRPPSDLSMDDETSGAGSSPEDRLAALRRRRRPGEDT